MCDKNCQVLYIEQKVQVAGFHNSALKVNNLDKQCRNILLQIQGYDKKGTDVETITTKQQGYGVSE